MSTELVSRESTPLETPEITKNVSKPLLKLKLLNVLRKGSITDLQDLLLKEFVPRTDDNVIEVVKMILHYAVQVAPLQLVKDIVTNKESFKNLEFSFEIININEKDNTGNTPLHLAAFQGRADVVSFLMDLSGINDTIVNNLNLQPVEMCKDLNVAQLMQYKRSNYVNEISLEFRNAFNNRDFQYLESILSNPRNFNLLDINGMDPKTGDTVLHEFVKKRDVIMCRWLLEHGADPFKRDAKGKLPIDLLKKIDVANANDNQFPSTTQNTFNNATATTKLAIDMELKKLLDKSAMEQSVIDITGVNSAAPVSSSNSENKININNNRIATPPTFKGYLRKWTNFAQGYKLRYFILSDDGKLSYYIDQADTQNACRGSLNVSNCSLYLDSSEKLKFEIISSTGNSAADIRWHLKGNHPIETNRWVWAIQGAIRYAKDKSKGLIPSQTTKQLHETLSLIENVDDVNNQLKQVDDLLTIHSSQHPSMEQQSQATATVPISAVEALKNNNIGSAKSDETISVDENVAENNNVDNSNATINSVPLLSVNDTASDNVALMSINLMQESEESDSEDEENENAEMFDIINGTNGEDLQISYGPFSHKLHMLKRSIGIDFTELIELLSDDEIANDDNKDIWNTVNKTLITMNNNFEKLNEYTQQRDKKLISMLSKQRDLNNVWIQSMKDLELELIEKDTKLIKSEKEMRSLKKSLGNVSKNLNSNAQTVSADNNENAETIKSNANFERISKLQEEVPEAIKSTIEDGDSDVDEFFDAEEFSDTDTPLETFENNDTKEGEEGEEGEFKVSTNNVEKAEGQNEKEDIEVNTKEASLKEQNDNIQNCVTDLQIAKQETFKATKMFDGYENGHRDRLALDSDTRPKVSLWGVLKSMVGKDMTKMALPVSFNEPSSLLQRLAEDVEYSSILTEAAKFSDSTLRMLYVAAFTISPYASTVNRIAKPFNPLLGETFEYANAQENYRFFTEQVSHHPPISATWAESTKWDYYGESNVDTKFNGRAFIIKHLGRWFCNIRPDNDTNGVKEEKYTWGKPQSTVIGILVGKPELDNSGEMKIQNVTTGDYCIINFKARGWTAVGAYEVRGEVFNKEGKKCWSLGGHWNDSIYAKKANDLAMENNIADGEDKTPLYEVPKLNGNKFLIWKVHKRDVGVPFNLTPFAITLNDPNADLIKYVAPTDSRLRPDQRAMEDGDYDLAATAKHKLEEKQRAVRKERENTGAKYQPKYFTLDMDLDTNTRIWKYNDNYWTKRPKSEWNDSYEIFQTDTDDSSNSG